jgi:hypothetical protein
MSNKSTIFPVVNIPLQDVKEPLKSKNAFTHRNVPVTFNSITADNAAAILAAEVSAAALSAAVLLLILLLPLLLLPPLLLLSLLLTLLLLLLAAAATPRAAHKLEGGARLEVANQFSSISLTLTFWGLLCTYLLSPKLCLKYKSCCLPLPGNHITNESAQKAQVLCSNAGHPS